MSYSEREQAIRNAFQTWSDASTLTFTQVYNPDSADIRLKWATGDHGDYNPFDGPLNVLAHAFLPPSGSSSFAGQVHFDDDETWTIGGFIDLETIALHEIGHALGLLHSSVLAAVMYSSYSTYSQKRTLHEDDKSGIWKLYGYPYPISGPTIPCGSSIYSVDSLPDSYSVTWSWKDSSTILISQNTPHANQCTIINNNQEHINNWLVATLSRGGTNVATVEKHIHTGDNFSGTYEQAGYSSGSFTLPAISPTTFYCESRVFVHPVTWVTLKSSHFVGANITYTGTAPDFWVHNDSIVRFKYLYPIPLSNMTNSLGTSDAGTLIITGKNPVSCETFRFNIWLITPGVPITLSLLTKSYGSEYTFELMPITKGQNGEEDVESIQSQLENWNLTIANTETGKVMFDGKIKGTEHTVNTKGWNAGVYVVRAQIGNEVISQKMIVSQ